MVKVHTSLAIFLRQPAPVEASRRDVEQALARLDFRLQSHEGSHYMWKHPDGTHFGYALLGGRKVKEVVVKAIAAEIRRRGLD